MDIRTLLQERDHVSTRWHGLTYAAIARQVGVSGARVQQIAVREQQRAKWLAIHYEEAKLPFVDRRVWFMPLRVRTRNALQNLTADTIPYWRHWHPPTVAIDYGSDLVQWTESDLLRLKHFGRSCLEDIRVLLMNEGYPSVVG